MRFAHEHGVFPAIKELVGKLGGLAKKKHEMPWAKLGEGGIYDYVKTDYEPLLAAVEEETSKLEAQGFGQNKETIDIDALREQFTLLRKEAWQWQEANASCTEAELNHYLESLIPKAIAITKKVFQATLGINPYDLQVAAATDLCYGVTAGIPTGEGKTYIAAIAAIINSLRLGNAGRTYILVPNDYLGERDQKKMSAVYQALGLASGCLDRELENRGGDGLDSDIVYLDYYALIFALLRDSQAKNKNELRLPYDDDNEFVLPGLMVFDEVDNLLDRISPLITSSQDPESELTPEALMDIEKLFSDYFAITNDLTSRVDLILDIPRIDGELDRLISEYQSLTNDGLVSDEEAEQLNPQLIHDLEEAMEEKKSLIDKLDNEKYDFYVDPSGALVFTDQGLDTVYKRAEELGFEVEQDLLIAAVTARYVLHPDEDYIITDNDSDSGDKSQSIVITDRDTQRPLENHKYLHSIHQLLEFKHGIKISAQERVSSLTTCLAFYSAMRGKTRISGMSGSLTPHVHEAFETMFDTAGVDFPNHTIFDFRGGAIASVVKGVSSILPGVQRAWFQNRYYPAKEHPTAESDDIVVEGIKNFSPEICITDQEQLERTIAMAISESEKGRPVLIATNNNEKAKGISELLHKQMIDHQLLIGIPELLAREEEIVSHAGRLDENGYGQITVATYLAGRGTDIILGRDPEEKEAILKNGGLCVLVCGSITPDAIGSLNRTIEQVKGRAARNGEPGSWQLITSLLGAIKSIVRVAEQPSEWTRLLKSAFPIEFAENQRKLLTLIISKAEEAEYNQLYQLIEANDLERPIHQMFSILFRTRLRILSTPVNDSERQEANEYWREKGMRASDEFDRAIKDLLTHTLQKTDAKKYLQLWRNMNPLLSEQILQGLALIILDELRMSLVDYYLHDYHRELLSRLLAGKRKQEAAITVIEQAITTIFSSVLERYLKGLLVREQ